MTAAGGFHLVPVMVSEDLWVRAVRAAAAQGTTVSALVCAVLQRLVDDVREP